MFKISVLKELNCIITMLKRFKTIKKRQDYVRKKFQKMGIGIYDYDEKKAEIFKELIKYHPEKNYSDIDHFILNFNPLNPTSYHTSFVRKSNPDAISFSWCKCCRLDKNFKNDNKYKFKDACRSAVSKDILDYKNNNKNAVCEICKARSNLQTDHVLPFSYIIDLFIKYENIKFQNIKYKKNEFCQFAFDDPILERKFYDFHRTKASYQTLCKKCNVKKSDKVILTF